MDGSYNDGTGTRRGLYMIRLGAMRETSEGTMGHCRGHYMIRQGALWEPSRDNSRGHLTEGNGARDGQVGLTAVAERDDDFLVTDVCQAARYLVCGTAAAL